MLVDGKFNDEGLRHLANVTTLEELSLDSMEVTDAAIEHLAGLKKLRKLHLGRTRVSEAGRRRLKELLPTVVIDS